MDSIRVSEAPDPSSILGETTFILTEIFNTPNNKAEYYLIFNFQ